MDGGRDEDRPHKQRSMDVGREQAVCCSFVLSVVPASSSTLSLANPAVENHSKMSINQELLPDEASLADSSPAPILTLAGNPLWGWQTLVVSTTVFPRPAPRHCIACCACNLPSTFYKHREIMQEMCCTALVLYGTTFALHLHPTSLWSIFLRIWEKNRIPISYF